MNYYPRTPEQVDQAQAEIIRGRLGEALDDALEAQGDRDITLREWWEWWETKSPSKAEGRG